MPLRIHSWQKPGKCQTRLSSCQRCSLARRKFPTRSARTLISARLGNRVPQIPNLQATAAAPTDPKQSAQKIAALPIGGRVKMDPWNDKLEMIKSKPIGTIAEREKMPFEVTPFMPYLTRYGTDTAKPIAASFTQPPDANKPDASEPA